MSEFNNPQSPKNRRLFLILAASLILLIILGAAVYGGYLLGQSSSSQISAMQTTNPEPSSSAVDLATQASTSVPTAVQVSPTVGITEPPAPTAVETATETHVVEMVEPPDMPAASETAVPTAESPTETEALPENAADELDLSTFYEVWGLINDEFDGQLPEDKELLYGAIAGSLNSLDDAYTRFIRPEIAERLRDDLDGSVSGIGAIVRPSDDGIIEIVRPLDGQPADLAGLKAGDLIIAVDGQSIAGMSFDEVLLMIRGPQGESVSLTIMREGAQEPLEFDLVRAEFEVPVVETQLFDEETRTIAYLRLSSFTRAADQEVTDALTTLLAQNPDGMILDLRDNGGGFLDQAVAIADRFLPEGIVLYERNNAGSVNETFRSQTGDIAEEIPLVLLVNAGSASASEIVAGAVKDNGRGILIGETTFGKGSVQHVHTLSDGSELRVTIARWFTPNNLSISEEGITPDIEVATPEDLGGEDDTQLQRAIDYLLEER
ncbi:MAG: S41 family peptidase [Candidatus Promineifilaceae bacterium]